MILTGTVFYLSIFTHNRIASSSSLLSGELQREKHINCVTFLKCCTHLIDVLKFRGKFLATRFLRRRVFWRWFCCVIFCCVITGECWCCYWRWWCCCRREGQYQTECQIQCFVTWKFTIDEWNVVIHRYKQISQLCFLNMVVWTRDLPRSGSEEIAVTMKQEYTT